MIPMPNVRRLRCLLGLALGLAAVPALA